MRRHEPPTVRKHEEREGCYVSLEPYLCPPGISPCFAVLLDTMAISFVLYYSH
jgi:hypothetical protein